MKKAPATEVAKRLTRHHYNTATTGGYAERVDSILKNWLEVRVAPANPDEFLSRLLNADGQLIRTGTACKPRSKNIWGIAYHDRGLPFVVIAGDWSTGTQAKYIAGTGESISPAEHREMNRRIAEAAQAREEDQARQWEKAAARAAHYWHSCKPADPEHPYLRRKGIQPHKARQHGRKLVLLITDFTGKAWSLQTIDETGKKRLMAGAKKKGNFIVINGPSYPARVLICEGFSTGCTLAENAPTALVLAAVDCGNLKAVATGARNRWPDADLIICGDDDRDKSVNAGATAARAAALAAGARFALPEWPPAAPLHLSDFNDLANWQRGQQ